MVGLRKQSQPALTLSATAQLDALSVSLRLDNHMQMLHKIT